MGFAAATTARSTHYASARANDQGTTSTTEPQRGRRHSHHAAQQGAPDSSDCADAAANDAGAA